MTEFRGLAPCWLACQQEMQICGIPPDTILGISSTDGQFIFIEKNCLLPQISPLVSFRMVRLFSDFHKANYDYFSANVFYMEMRITYTSKTPFWAKVTKDIPYKGIININHKAMSPEFHTTTIIDVVYSSLILKKWKVTILNQYMKCLGRTNPFVRTMLPYPLSGKSITIVMSVMPIVVMSGDLEITAFRPWRGIEMKIIYTYGELKILGNHFQ